MLPTHRWLRNKRMLPTAHHNTPQRALSRRTVAGRPGICKKKNFETFLADILTVKTVPQSSPERYIFI